jgi:cytochrome b6-f complex iron-sulfur subunit
MSDRTEPQEPAGGPANEQEIPRRDFVNGTWKVLGVALVAEAAWTSYDILNPRSAAGSGNVVDAGPVSDYSDEGAVQYFVNGRFYVTQYQGGLRALYQKCPHLGCRVPFCQSAAQFQCPCHGSVYNIIGEYLQGPAPRGMDRFPIRIEQDRVVVDTTTPVEGPPRGVVMGPNAAAGPSCVTGSGGEAGVAQGGSA